MRTYVGTGGCDRHPITRFFPQPLSRRAVISFKDVKMADNSNFSDEGANDLVPFIPDAMAALAAESGRRRYWAAL